MCFAFGMFFSLQLSSLSYCGVGSCGRGCLFLPLVFHVLVWNLPEDQIRSQRFGKFRRSIIFRGHFHVVVVNHNFPYHHFNFTNYYVLHLNVIIMGLVCWRNFTLEQIYKMYVWVMEYVLFFKVVFLDQFKKRSFFIWNIKLL